MTSNANAGDGDGGGVGGGERGAEASFSVLRRLSMLEESSGMHSSLLYSACHLFPRTTANCMLTNEGGTQSKGLPREKGAEKVALDLVRQRACNRVRPKKTNKFPGI